MTIALTKVDRKKMTRMKIHLRTVREDAGAKVKVSWRCHCRADAVKKLVMNSQK